MTNSLRELEGLKETLRETLSDILKEASSDVEKGKLFLKWALGKVFELTEDEAGDAIVDGAYDRGIDAYWPIEGEEQEREIYIIQAKVGTSHSADRVEEFKRKIEAVLLASPSEIERTDIADIARRFKDAEVRHLVYLTDQEIQAQGGATIKVANLEAKFDIIGINNIAAIIWDRIKEPAKEQWADLKIESLNEYENCFIAVVTLGELGRFVNDTWDYIFESNIRHFLKWKTKVNQGIRETLEKQPEKFFYYNNGITVVAQGVKKQEDNTLSLYSPQIVNGAQTSSAINDAWRRNHDIGGYILVTIIKERSRGEMGHITRYRNSQNAVRGKDLVGLLDFHRSLQIQFGELGYFYEIQSGKFDSLRRNEKSRYQGTEKFNKYLEGKRAPYCIPSKDAIQAFLAGIMLLPTEAHGRPSDYLPNGRRYDTVFTDDLKSEYRLFFFPWLVKEYAKGKLGYGKTAEISKRRAIFFYTFVYFYILGKVFQIEPGQLKSIENYKDKIDKVIDDFETNKSILELADRMVVKFLEDSQVEEKITGVGIDNFFKSNADREDMRAILFQKIARVEDEIRRVKVTLGV